jgi:sentrin-specific protease 8
MTFSDIKDRIGEALKPTSHLGLSYYDVYVTPDDIRCLKMDWLTDNNIAFWQEWLERETLPKFPEAQVVLLRPTMAFLLMKDPNIESARSALPAMDGVTHIFLPINNSRSVTESESGSHWSLLIVSVGDRMAFHYDSLRGSNMYEARHAMERFSDLLGLHGRDRIRFVQIDDTPQQENGRDCGMYVCLLMRHLLVDRLLRSNVTAKVTMGVSHQAIDAYAGRREMLGIIESLRKEAEKRRS